MKAYNNCLWRVTLIVLLALMPWRSADAQTSDPLALTPDNLAAYFDAAMAEQMAADHVVGATVAVVVDGELRFAQGYGLSNLADERPVVADETLFFPGSVGKLFTWTAVMQLVEQGKLDLHTDINAYLDFPIPATFDDPITLAHLMTHTAGFEDQLAAIQVARADDLLPLRDFLLTFMPARVYPPGEYFAYSNYGTALAGYIVERVAGQPYAAYITDHVLTPLAMTRSFAGQPLPPELMADYSQGYHDGDDGYTAADFEWIAALPEAPVRATATDMARFMLAHLNGGELDGQRILSEADVAAMHQLHFAHDPWLMGMGYGFMISQENGRAVSWHTGGSAHFTTLLALLPAENVGLYITFNTPVADLRQVLTDFVNHFYPVAPPAHITPPADTQGRLDALAGSYAPAISSHSTPQKFISLVQQVTARVEDETLQVGPHRYVEVEPTRFMQVNGPRKLTYRTDEAGAVEAIFWGPYVYLRLPWHQAAGVQLALPALGLLIFITAALAWLVDLLLRRRRQRPAPPRWTCWARGSALTLGALHGALLAWFLIAMLGYSATYVFPVESVALITQLWWLSVPLTAAVVAFAVLAWLRPAWRPAWRLHYALVAIAGVVWLAWLVNWNLLA